MAEEFKLVKIKEIPEEYNISFLSEKEAEKVQKFHASFPVYDKTPLASFPDTAKALGLGDIFVKDESYRFGLNAFKVLGGSYAIGNYMAKKLGEDISRLTFEQLASDETREKLGEITFVTATDGNHGRGGVDSQTIKTAGSCVYAKGKRPGAASQYSGRGSRGRDD